MHFTAGKLNKLVNAYTFLGEESVICIRVRSCNAYAFCAETNCGSENKGILGPGNIREVAQLQG